MKDLIPVLAFYVALVLLLVLFWVKLVAWLLGGLALGVNG